MDQAGLAVDIKNEKNPIPGVWSVHLTEKTTGLYTNGKGATRLAAIASAYGEFCERLGTGYFFAPLCTGSFRPRRKDGTAISWLFDPAESWQSKPAKMLNPGLWKLYDPDNAFRAEYRKNPLALAVLNDAHTGGMPRPDFAPEGICCLPFLPLPVDDTTAQGAGVLFPLNLIWNLYASNGLSAGNSPLEARVQSLSEIVERHVKYRIISESLCLPDIPASHITAGVQASITAMEAMGYRVLAKDASLGGQYPVIAVALIMPASGEMLLSFGAHPRFAVALERTVTELLQGRVLEYTSEFTAPNRDAAMTSEPANLESHFINSTGLVPSRFFADQPDYAFTPWTVPATREAEYALLRDILSRDGMSAYIRERSFMGLHVCQILAPGMSEIYPFAELWEQNTSRYQAFRSLLTRTDSLSGREIIALAALAEEEFSSPNNGQSLLDLLGIDAAGAAFWEAMTVGELLALLKLQSGAHDEVREFLNYVFDWDAVRPIKRAFWRAVADLLETPNQSPADTIFPRVLYETKQLDAAIEAVKGWPHSLFPALGDDFSNAVSQGRLLALYESYCRLLAAIP